MPAQKPWIQGRLAEARKAYPLVTTPASDQLDELLGGRLSERPLTPGELATVAKALIANMTPARSEAEAEA